MTKAKTIQARRKFKKRCPFKQVRVSGAEEDVLDAATLLSLACCCCCCCPGSISLGPTTLLAIELQISQVLQFNSSISNTISESKVKRE